MQALRRLRTVATLVACCLLGGASAVAVASGGGRDNGEDNGTTVTTSGETTTGETTTDGTTTDATTTIGTTTTTGTTPTASGAPRIAEVEVDGLSGRRLRLRAEIAGRARVTLVRFSYRGRSFAGRRRAGGNWSRVVRARGGDGRGDIVSVRVRACNGSRCATVVRRDEA